MVIVKPGVKFNLRHLRQRGAARLSTPGTDTPVSVSIEFIQVLEAREAEDHQKIAEAVRIYERSPIANGTAAGPALPGALRRRVTTVEAAPDHAWEAGNHKGKTAMTDNKREPICYHLLLSTVNYMSGHTAKYKRADTRLMSTHA